MDADHLILSHAAWTAQRSVRFGDWLCMETYWDAFHGYPEVMLFDLAADPYEQRDLASAGPTWSSTRRDSSTSGRRRP